MCKSSLIGKQYDRLGSVRNRFGGIERINSRNEGSTRVREIGAGETRGESTKERSAVHALFHKRSSRARYCLQMVRAQTTRGPPSKKRTTATTATTVSRVPCADLRDDGRAMWLSRTLGRVTRRAARRDATRCRVDRRQRGRLADECPRRPGRRHPASARVPTPLAARSVRARASGFPLRAPVTAMPTTARSDRGGDPTSLERRVNPLGSSSSASMRYPRRSRRRPPRASRPDAAPDRAGF